MDRVNNTFKTPQRIVDLFEHCEYKCSAHCCEWEAFDLSPHWIWSMV